MAKIGRPRANFSCRLTGCRNRSYTEGGLCRACADANRIDMNEHPLSDALEHFNDTSRVDWINPTPKTSRI